jgi:UDPglucose 6-dehydrogenase
MRICVVGSGYVGLVTGTCLAEMGNQVCCVDRDKERVVMLQDGRVPIFEPGLAELILSNVRDGRLSFSAELAQGLDSAECCFIAVGTPTAPDGSADISQVLNVARNIGHTLKNNCVVVTKSTVPVGTTENVRALIRSTLIERNRADIQVDVVSNPEFLKEGAAIEDFMKPDRIVIGTDNPDSENLMRRLYAPFVQNQNPLLFMDIRSAELTKYASNGMLATRISYMNELAKLCDKVGADISKVRTGMGTDRRIGMPFLYAGCGYGGSCFPKDVQELAHIGYRNGLDMKVLGAVHAANEAQKEYLAEQAERHFGKQMKNLRFAVWGLAFKPQTDDMREAPSISLIRRLAANGAQINAYDPAARKTAAVFFTDLPEQVAIQDDMMKVLDGADALFLVTEWRQFRQPDFAQIKSKLKQAVIFDGRNQYDGDSLRQMGFEYYCIGRNGHVK